MVLDIGTPWTEGTTGRWVNQVRRPTRDGGQPRVTGKAGERYLRLVGAPLFGVEVEVKGNKKANTEFKGSNAQEMNNNFLYAYQPQDAIIPFKGDSAPPYRLTLNKHPWFGNIQTDWIE